MAQYGQGIGFNSRRYSAGLAAYIARRRTENGTTAVVARGLRYDISCPHCTACMSVPVGSSIECPECACPLTVMP